MNPKLYHDHYYDQFDHHHNHYVGHDTTNYFTLRELSDYLYPLFWDLNLNYIFVTFPTGSSKVDMFYNTGISPFHFQVQFLKIAKI